MTTDLLFILPFSRRHVKGITKAKAEKQDIFILLRPVDKNQVSNREAMSLLCNIGFATTMVL